MQPLWSECSLEGALSIAAYVDVALCAAVVRHVIEQAVVLGLAALPILLCSRCCVHLQQGPHRQRA